MPTNAAPILTTGHSEIDPATGKAVSLRIADDTSGIGRARTAFYENFLFLSVECGTLATFLGF